MKKTIFNLFFGLAGSAILSFTASAQTIYFHTSQDAALSNPYQSPSGEWWNKLTAITVGTPVSNAVDINNQATGVSWTTNQRLGYVFDNGPASSTMGYPDTVSKNGFFLNRSDYLSGQFTITGLTVGQLYDFTFYGTMRAGDPTFPTRSLDIVVTDDLAAYSDALVLTASATEADQAEILFTNLLPNSSGVITVNLAVSSGYNRGNLNALKIVAVPEPVTGTLLLLSAAGILAFQYRRKG